MSKTAETDDTDEGKSRREHLWELATSDRDTAPVYAAYYEREYGTDPTEDATFTEGS